MKQNMNQLIKSFSSKLINFKNKQLASFAESAF
jgi:hypothetical protein